MDTKGITEPDRLVSAYLQRPIRSYEEVLKARETARTTAPSYIRLVPKRPVEIER